MNVLLASIPMTGHFNPILVAARILKLQPLPWRHSQFRRCPTLEFGRMPVAPPENKH